MEQKRRPLCRTLSLALALLAVVLLPLQSAGALFGKEKETPRAEEGAPVAREISARVYRGVPFTGRFAAVDNEGGALTFAITSQPKKGTLALTDDGLGFVYTPTGRLGADSFTYTASDEEGNTSRSATVNLTIERVTSGVRYADMAENAAHTAAVDLAEQGVFVGARLGESYFFEPERTLSRGEFIAMSLCAMGVASEEVGMTGFCDDPDIPTWAKGSAVAALNAGVVTGSDTDAGVAYRARDAITLNEAAVVLNRLLRVTDVDLSDYDAAESWCAQAVANLQSVRVLETGRFTAEELGAGLTRAQAAELLSAAMTLRRGEAEKGLLSGVFS